jgi:hypothetical protein
MHISVIVCNETREEYEKHINTQIKLLKFIKTNTQNIKSNGHSVKVIIVNTVPEYKKLMKKHKITTFPVVITKSVVYKTNKEIQEFFHHVSMKKTPIRQPMSLPTIRPEKIPRSAEDIWERQAADLGHPSDDSDDDHEGNDFKRRAADMEKRRKTMVRGKGHTETQPEEVESDDDYDEPPPPPSSRSKSVHTGDVERRSNSPTHPDDDLLSSKLDI